MAEYVKRAGTHIIADQETIRDPVNFVQQVLDLKTKFDCIVAKCFRGEKRAQKKLKEAFDEFLNKDNRCASYLASFIDELLKSGLRGKTEEEAETKLDQVILIFRCGYLPPYFPAPHLFYPHIHHPLIFRFILIFRHLQDKDLFESYYKQHLAKRLLSSSSVSDEIEESMLKKLKTECGYQFISKLEGMFLDVRNSKVIMEEYRETHFFQSCPVEIKVDVLTQGFWPSNSTPVCNLPPIVSASCDAFTAFYLQRHTGVKLVWQTHLGNTDLRANFSAGGKKELNVTTYQMCILLMFNGRDTLTLDEIREAVICPEVELRRHLLSLCTPKLKILSKESKCKGIVDGDIFTFNESFTSKYKRIKIPLISSKEITSDSLTADGINTISGTMST